MLCCIDGILKVYASVFLKTNLVSSVQGWFFGFLLLFGFFLCGCCIILIDPLREWKSSSSEPEFFPGFGTKLFLKKKKQAGLVILIPAVSYGIY